MAAGHPRAVRDLIPAVDVPERDDPPPLWLEGVVRPVRWAMPDGDHRLMCDQPHGSALPRWRPCGVCLESPGLEFHVLEIHQAFTSYSNPKINEDTEPCMRTLKNECPQLHEWTCPSTLIRVVGSWIDDDNEHYLYSALDYKTPKHVEGESYTGQSFPFVAACAIGSIT
jgi:hypothetical protein